MSFFSWAPRKTAAARRADTARHIRAATKAGTPLSPVAIEGRTIARTYWGKAWCDNLERYRDFAYRLERGRSYVRSGSVIDLRIDAGTVHAKVSGSEVYAISIAVDAVPAEHWRALQRDCAGGIGSRVDLLGGKLSDAVMARLCADRTGLFPPPSAIRFTCSCPDYAIMCKHVAAVMYGVGARLDRAPELLFTLRGVAIDDLVAAALSESPVTRPTSSRVLASDGLAAMFGIELAEPAAGRPAAQPRKAKAATSPKPRVEAVRSKQRPPVVKKSVTTSRRLRARAVRKSK
ncbi:MAG: SWIM zinc finger family protein [Kofleriaceae bacterium]